MLMIYGLFVFSVQSVPFNEVQRQQNWRWANNNRVGLHPAYQFVGKGEECITLSGTLMPEFSGGEMSLSLLQTLADSGKAWLLMSGYGKIYGYYFIESISETQSYLLKDGQPQKIDFTISLKRYDGKLSERMGQLSAVLPLINKIF